MKWGKKFIVSLAAVSILLPLALETDASAASNDLSLVANEDGLFDSIPNVYEVETTYKNLGEYGTLNHAEDLFVDGEDQLYIADTGNNRILKLSMDGTVLAEYREGFDVPFKGPKGVYVHPDGTIWVADTGNYRIVRINQDGSDNEVYYKPESSLLEESFTFAPEKIYVSQTGYIYVLKGSNLMLMDAKNEFRGYLGAATVPFSFQRFLIRTFGTRSQKERTVKQEPSSYTNFMIASDGMAYGILANELTGQIRKLNSVGTNSYPELPYGFSITLDDTNFSVIKFSDINVMDNGIITLADQSTGLLYQYDQDGDLLAMFGGNGSVKGTYTTPSSIVSDSLGRIYVLDYTTNTVTVLQPTRFIQLIHQAVQLYDVGRYEESKDYWQQVLAIDSNYALAHSGYAKVLYKEGLYEESVEEYRLGNDKEGYSQSFAEYRHDLFRQYFGWIVLAIVVLCGAVWIGFKKLRKWGDTMAHKIEMGGWLK